MAAMAGLGGLSRGNFTLSPRLVFCVHRGRQSPAVSPFLPSLYIVVTSDSRGRRRASGFPPPRDPLQIRRRSSVAAIEVVAVPDVVAAEGRREPASMPSAKPNEKACENDDGPRWRKMNSKELGIKSSMITKATKSVMNLIRENGHEVYLVGGCVRDLILKRTPKDFDVITSAELNEVRRMFPRCEIVGKRFPICHVHVKDTIVEVSSFSTSVGKSSKHLSSFYRKPPGCSDHDYARWRNCLARDFTINGFGL